MGERWGGAVTRKPEEGRKAPALPCHGAMACPPRGA